MKIQQSAEDYFETIYILKKRNGSVRAIDIATELGFSKPTVSVAMKKFRENGFITVDEAGQIELTAEGRAIAEKTYDKHNVIAEALIAMGVDRDTAIEDSCKIEHCLSDESFSAIKAYLASIKK